MSEIDTSRLINELQGLARAAQGGGRPDETTAPEGFADLLKAAVEGVNARQQQAGALARAFETGERDVDLVEVMVALQKSSLSFQALTQVRNKMVAAYQEIMGMQV